MCPIQSESQLREAVGENSCTFSAHQVLLRSLPGDRAGGICTTLLEGDSEKAVCVEGATAMLGSPRFFTPQPPKVL